MIKKKSAEKIPHLNRHTTNKKHSTSHSQNGEKKHKNRKQYNDFFKEHGDHLALGGVAMGIAGIATFLLLNSMNKKRGFGERVCNTYAEYKEDAEDIANNVYEKGREIYDYATDYADNMKNKIKDKPNWSLFVLGAAAGVTIGGTLAYLSNHKSNNKNFLDKFIDVVDNIKESTSSVTDNINANEWVQTAKDILENINEKINSGKKSSELHDSLQKAINLGLTGYKLWECFAKKKQ